MLTIEWLNQEWGLLAEKALLWPAQRAAIVADVHLGKAAAFRHLGVPVPEATTTHDLARLTRIVQLTECKHLIVLGDLLHAHHGRGDATMRTIALWRAMHASLRITLVRGNHDLASGDPPEEWRIECVDEPLEIGGIMLRHAPNDRTTEAGMTDAPVIAGHVHPCVRLRDRDNGDAARVACFVFSERSALLPAFGSFTGTHALRPRQGDRIFAVAENQVNEIAAVVT